jgi:DNA modification methylase
MIETNTVYCEDNVKTLQRMPDNYINMSLTSPPFGLARLYEGFSWDIDTLVPLLLQKTTEGGSCVWVIGNQTINGSETGEAFMHALRFLQHGWKLNDTMIFAKNNPLPGDCGPRYRQAFDFIFVFTKGKLKTFNPILEPTKEAGKHYNSLRVTQTGRGAENEGVRVVKPERKKSNIFYYNVGSASSKDKIAFEHPAIFPEKLAEDMIGSYSNEGDIVFDPFAGSGTALKLAKQLNRSFIGAEISETYCQIIEKRLA